MQSAVLAMIDSVCPSVCMSVTVRYHVKMTQATIMSSSLEDSHMTLVSPWLTSSRNSEGNIGSVGAVWERGRKNTQFSANKSPYSQKRCKIGPKLLLITNKNSYMRFWLVPRSSTLDDPELLAVRSNFLGILRQFPCLGGNKKIDPHCQRGNCLARKVLFNDV